MGTPAQRAKRKASRGGRLQLVDQAERSARIMIYGYIGDDWDGITAKMFQQMLLEVGEVEELILEINSLGGDVFEAVNIYGAAVMHSAHVITEIPAVAASAAAFIAQAGDERRISENGQFMVHRASGGVWGNAQEIRDYLKLLDNTDEMLQRVFAARTGLDAETLEEVLSRDSWLTAEESLVLGFVDEVVSLNPKPPHVEPENLSLRIHLSPARIDAARQSYHRLAAIAADLPGAEPVTKPNATPAKTPDPEHADPNSNHTPEPAQPANAPGPDTSPPADNPPAPAAEPAAAAPAPVSAPVVSDPAAEARKRAAEIADLTSKCGCPQKAGEFIALNYSIDQVREYLVNQQILSRPLTPDPPATGDDPPIKKDDPKARFETEYDEHGAHYASIGLSKKQYVRSRMVDEGHLTLQQAIAASDD